MTGGGEIPAGAAVITAGQMFQELRETGAKVDRLVALVDPALSNVRADLGSLRSEVVQDAIDIRVITTDHENRLRALQRSVWMATGSAASVTGLIAWALSKVGG